MQDRFKFRAWKKISQIYDYDIQECEKIPLHNSNKEKCFACFQSYLKNQDIFEIEQCTGLKDKNGKLIYEGDIIKVTSPKNWNIFDEYSNSEILGKGVVVTKPGCAFIKKNDIDGEEKKYYFALYSVVEDADVEVVGNIHENPELLEEDK